jgi:hypothetical protein
MASSSCDVPVRCRSDTCLQVAQCLAREPKSGSGQSRSEDSVWRPFSWPIFHLGNTLGNTRQGDGSSRSSTKKTQRGLIRRGLPDFCHLKSGEKLFFPMPCDTGHRLVPMMGGWSGCFAGQGNQKTAWWFQVEQIQRVFRLFFYA